MADEKQERSSSMPILQRLDRLERSLHFLEDNHCLSSKSSSEEAAQDHKTTYMKTLSSAVDEVRCKGTLMERVAMLESRVLHLQLSLEMDVENASSSSCSTILVSDQKYQHDKEGSLLNGPQGLGKAGRRRTRRSNIYTIQLREWFRWPSMGCSS